MKASASLRAGVATLAALLLPIALSAQVLTPPFPKNTNQSRKLRSVAIGGAGNFIPSNSATAFIGGGQSNKASDLCAVASGGFMNTADDGFTTVAGGAENRASGNYATAGGGWRNVSSGGRAIIAGGEQNIASGYLSTVAGGFDNKATNDRTFIGGGSENVNGSLSGVIGGGYKNKIYSENATVGGGLLNEIYGISSTVGGGRDNKINAGYGTIPGGVGGRVSHYGSFVWSGDTSGELTYSTTPGSFTVRCEGGATFYTADGIGVGPRMGPGGTQWITTSDSNLKTKVTAVNTKQILAKLSRLPVTEWEYKHNPNRRYIGPMAQDFHAAFGLGDDDKGIGTLDSDGVMYAAIQGLIEELKDRDKAMADRDRQINELKAKSEAVEARNEELSRKIKAINERLDTLPPQP